MMASVRARAAIAAATVLLVTGGLHAKEPGALREKKQKLERLKKEIAEERRKAEETAAREAEVETTLKKINSQLQEKTADLKQLETNLRAEEQSLRALKKEIASAEHHQDETAARWAGRLRALYKQGQFGVFRLLFSAESFTDVARRMKYLRTITAEDRALSEQYAATLSRLSTQEAKLEARRATLARSRNRVRTTEAAIADEKWRQRILLARLREEKEGYLTAIRELEAVSSRLQDLINELSKRAKAKKQPAPPILDSPFAARKGKLPWPTDGDVAFRFGRQGEQKRRAMIFNKGIGIRAPLGQPFRVVYEGTVLFADWFRGYGRLVIVDHGYGFFSLYAYASELLVQMGDEVHAGQPIGRVGETGSLEGPQLYFELRYHGEPQDPLLWLAPRG